MAILQFLSATEQIEADLWIQYSELGGAQDHEVLPILLSIGPSETMHFQTWQDKAGNALPITDTDIGFPGRPGATVSFADLTQTQGETNPESINGDTLQADLIMPEPCHFPNPALGPVPSSVRPRPGSTARWRLSRASWMTDCSSGRRIRPS